MMFLLSLKGSVGTDQLEKEVEAEGAAWTVRKEPDKDETSAGGQAWL